MRRKRTRRHGSECPRYHYLERKQLRLCVFQVQEDSEDRSSGPLGGVSSTTVFLTASELQCLQLRPFNRDLQ